MIVLLLLLTPALVFAEDAPQDATPMVKMIVDSESELQQWRVLARNNKRLKVVSCMDKKLQRLQGLVSVSKRTQQAYQKAVASKDQNTEKYWNRLVFAQRRADSIIPQTARCWCEDDDIDSLPLASLELPGLKRQTVALKKLCEADGLPETVVRLEAPETQEGLQVNLDPVDETGNSGFPEIPPASPFR